MKIKKSVIASIVIAAIMLLSILSFPLVMWFNPRDEVDKEDTEYIKRGITIIYIYHDKYQHSKEMQNIKNLIKEIPEKYTTALGETQILIKEINNSEEKIIMRSYNGERLIGREDFKKENIIKNLCEILVYSSLECINAVS